MLYSVLKDGCLLKYGSDNIKNNKNIVLSAVKQDSFALKYASDNLKKNEEIISNAIKNNGMILEYILEEDLQNEKKVINDPNSIKFAVLSNGLALQFASDELKDSMEIVEKAVIQNGLAIQYASDKLKDSMEIVKKAVIQNGLALQYASDRLKDNKIIVNTAIKHNGLALQYVSDKLKSRVKIIIKALKQNGLALQYVPEYIKMRNIDITGVAIRNNILAINYSTIKLNDLSRVSFLIYNYNVELIKYADYDIKNNYYVILYCVKKNGLLLEFASNKLKRNNDIIKAAIKQNLLACAFIEPDLCSSSEILFNLFFKQRNLLFLLNYNVYNPNPQYYEQRGRTITDELNKVIEYYPLRINIDNCDDNLVSYLYYYFFDIYISNKEIPIKLRNIIKELINIYFNRGSTDNYVANRDFLQVITDNNYIRTYFVLMLKCCLKVSNYYENSTDKNEALFNVKNYPILKSTQDRNEFYRYIGLIKELKDTVLSKSGLLKLLLKKICIKLNNDKKSKMIHNLIIKSSINRKMVNSKLKIIRRSNYYNRISKLEDNF
jgi:hypothetical protein